MNNPFKNPRSLDIYQNKSEYKWLILILAIIIGTASIIYTNTLVTQLKEREKRLIELYAKTLEYTANETSSDNLSFIFQEIIVPNNSIPVIWTDGAGRAIEYRNLDIDEGLSDKEKTEILDEELELMQQEHEPIMLKFFDETGEIDDYNYVYYKNSKLLYQLRYYPHVQLTIIAIFGLLTYLAFNYSKTAEQNRIWVGLAKETAHQLGTPISSLMAWVEYFKSENQFKDSSVLTELEKDIYRLEMITSRFSSIGSVPILNSENIHESINNTIIYLQTRLGTKVTFSLHSPPEDISANINKPLFDWVIENICKNAVDAMGGAGNIDINIKKGLDNNVVIDITDTGKGIPKSKYKTIFLPGYTTKSRGWGLGLTLVKRIVEIYHEGKIFVKSSDTGAGTTFRIILRV
ncbi:PAS domain-containing sensor histidine kinase [Bacteroidota bacterium]